MMSFANAVVKIKCEPQLMKFRNARYEFRSPKENIPNSNNPNGLMTFISGTLPNSKNLLIGNSHAKSNFWQSIFRYGKHTGHFIQHPVVSARMSFKSGCLENHTQTAQELYTVHFSLFLEFIHYHLQNVFVQMPTRSKHGLATNLNIFLP